MLKFKLIIKRVPTLVSLSRALSARRLLKSQLRYATFPQRWDVKLGSVFRVWWDLFGVRFGGSCLWNDNNNNPLCHSTGSAGPGRENEVWQCLGLRRVHHGPDPVRHLRHVLHADRADHRHHRHTGHQDAEPVRVTHRKAVDIHRAGVSHRDGQRSLSSHPPSKEWMCVQVLTFNMRCRREEMRPRSGEPGRLEGMLGLMVWPYNTVAPLETG